MWAMQKTALKHFNDAGGGNDAQPALKAGIAEGIVHLARVEVDFQFRIVEHAGFTFLVNNAVNRVTGFFEGIDNLVPAAFHPQVDISAHPA